MKTRFEIPLSQKITPETPFDDAFNITRRNHVMFMISGLVYVLVAWLIQQFVWGGQPTGFLNLPELTYLMLAGAAVVLTLAAIAALFLILPKMTSPAAVLDKKDISTVETLGFELSQAHMVRIVAAQTPAILGLVLYLLNGNIPHMIIFVAISLLLLLATFPRRDDWEEGKRLFERQKAMRG